VSAITYAGVVCVLAYLVPFQRVGVNPCASIRLREISLPLLEPSHIRLVGRQPLLKSALSFYKVTHTTAMPEDEPTSTDIGSIN